MLRDVALACWIHSYSCLECSLHSRNELGPFLFTQNLVCDSFYGFLSMAVQNVTKVGRSSWNCNTYIWREFLLCVVWGFWVFPSLDLMYPLLQIVVEEQVGKLSMCKMDFLIREGEEPAGVICRVSLGCTQILFSPWDSRSEDWITSGVDDWCHVPVFLSVTFLRKENYLAASWCKSFRRRVTVGLKLLTWLAICLLATVWCLEKWKEQNASPHEITVSTNAVDSIAS